MKIDQLRYFLAAANHGSFASAGAHLNISPTSIGYAVDKLEEEFKTSLFVRKPSKGLTLTPDGESLVEHSRQILSELNSIAGQYKAPGQQIRGELLVGCQEGLMWSLIPRAIRILAKRHPDLRISVITTELDVNLSALENGSIDVLVTFFPEKTESTSCDLIYLSKPSLYAMMRKNHPLDKGDKPVRLKDLAKYPQVMNNEPQAFDLVYDNYKKHKLAPPVGFLSSMSAGAQAIVGNSDYISMRILRPACDVSPLGDQLVYRKIKEKVRETDIVAAKIKSRSPHIHTKHDAFIDVCKMLFDSGEMREHLLY